MADKTPPHKPKAAPAAASGRQDRLKSALRDNLKKRKAQARARHSGADDSARQKP